MDTKVRDVENWPDQYVDVCLFNGSVRTSEQEYMAKLLRQKSKVLVAFGSCATEGCIPGLANLTDRQEIFETVYCESSSTDNPKHVLPLPEVHADGHHLSLPVFYDTVRTLAQTVPVDYFLPGCPPGSGSHLGRRRGDPGGQVATGRLGDWRDDNLLR